MTSKLKVNLINDAGDNNLITSDGSGSVTLGAAFPAVGKVLQVLTNEYTTTGATTSSSSFTELGPQLQITPSASNTKMLVSVQGGSTYTATDKNIMWTIYRDVSGGSATNLGGTDGLYKHFANSSFLLGGVTMQVLDTHGTTSNIEYKCFVRTSTSSAVTIQDSPTKTVMTVIEVSA